MRVGGKRATAKDRERAQEWMNERERELKETGLELKLKKCTWRKKVEGNGERWQALPAGLKQTNKQTNHLDPKVIK